MSKQRSVNSPLDYENGKNDGLFVRIRIAASADIIQQRWQTKTEIEPPLLFLSSERWLCDWSDGDFEEGKFSIDDSSNNENYTLTLRFLSRVSPLDFQEWFAKTLKKQQVCLELTDANNNERVFNPFDVNYKFDQKSNNGEFTSYEISFVKSKLNETKDRIIAVQTDCSTGITKFIFASGKPELYEISYFGNNVNYDANIGITGIPDGQYIGFARLKGSIDYILSTNFSVKCNSCTLTITEITEVVAGCSIAIVGIEEITVLAENEGILIIGINQ